MKETLVSVDFVKQAHAAACSEWKQKIENEFPALFEKALAGGSRIQIKNCGNFYMLVHVGSLAYLCNENNGNVWSSHPMDYDKGFVTESQIKSYITKDREWIIVNHVLPSF